MSPTSAPSFVAWLSIGALALVPLLLVMTTSYVKLSVVFSLLRNALGVPDVPSGLVVTALSVALSLFVMGPTLDAMVQATAPQWAQVDLQEPFAQRNLATTLSVIAAAKEPLRAFLDRNTGASERALFVQLSPRTGGAAGDLTLLAPAFLLTELKEALLIAFLLFLPFLVLDVVIASLLVALGMHALSPSQLALPFKLLLFVLIDGFVLLSRALVAGYQ